MSLKERVVNSNLNDPLKTAILRIILAADLLNRFVGRQV